MANFIGSYLNTIKPLVMMQLKDKVDFSFMKTRKNRIFKFVYSVALFVLLTAIIYIVFGLIIKLNILSYTKFLNFRAYALLMGIILALSFVSCLINLTKTLYFAKDNQVLLTIPVKSSKLFSSKLAVVFIYELTKNLGYILPFFVAYGMVSGVAIWFYLWTVLMVVLITIAMIVVSGFLSIPAMLITIWLKKTKVLEIAVLVAAVIGLVTLVVFGIRAIPTDINLIRDWGKIYWKVVGFLEDFNKHFAGVVYLIQFFTGTRYSSAKFNLGHLDNLFTFLVLFVVIIVSLLITYFLSKPLFFKMASSPFEYKKKDKKFNKKNHKFIPFVSVVNVETKKTLRTSNVLYTLLAICIITPIAVMFENQIIAAMDIRILGGYMCLVFNVLIIMLLILSSNVTIASLYSREGNAAYLNKVNPVQYRKILFGKLIFHTLLTNVSIIISTIVIDLYLRIGVLSSVFLALSMMFANTAHILWSAELDVMNPQNRQYQTTGEHNKNPNETKSTIIAFVVAFLLTIFSFFLITENASVVYFKIMLICFAFLLCRVYLYFTRVNLFYKEKE